MGEAILAQWASQLGLPINQAHQDLHGWDFLLEIDRFFNHSPVSSQPPDKTLSLKAFVQVKATDKLSPRIQVKLDNLERLIKSPYPSFILVLAYHGSDNPVDAFLIHIEGDIFRQVLLRLRQADSKKDVPLRKQSMAVRCLPEHRLQQPNSISLKDKIVSFIGAQPEQYCDNKLRHLNEVGYEKGKKEIRVLFQGFDNPLDAQSALVDLSLGILPSIQCGRIDIYDSRFGIPASDPEAVLHDGMLELIPKPAFTTEITFSVPSQDKSVTIHFHSYAPMRVGTEVNPTLKKYHFRCPHISVLYWPDQNDTLNFSFNPPDTNLPTLLKDLVPVARCLSLFSTAHRIKEPVHHSIYIDGKWLGSGEFHVTDAIDPTTATFSYAVLHLWEITKRFELHDSLEITIDELLHHAAVLTLMHALIGGPIIAMRNELTSEYLMELLGHTVCIPIVRAAQFGRSIFFMSGAMIGQLEQLIDDAEPDKWRVTTTDIRFHDAAHHKEGIDVAEVIERLKTKVIDHYSPEFPCIGCYKIE